MVVPSRALGRGLKAKIGSLDTPSSPSPPALRPAEQSPAESLPVPRARAWDSRSQEAGRATRSGRSWVASAYASSSSSLDSPRWVSASIPQKAPRVWSELGQGAGAQADSDQKASTSFLFPAPTGGVTLLWRPVAFSKLFHSWVAKRNNSYGICTFGTETEGHPKKLLPAVRVVLGPKLEAQGKPDPTDA